MKIVHHIATAQNVTFLPPEVLESIIDCLLARKWSTAVQRDLWACCLIAKGWYEVVIPYLYRHPILSPRNFHSFARTLSPPIASRTRRLGLEDLVHYLDMGTLAYESKKSTTARLISRTKNSLQILTAPAVTFSTTCLAPLVRCTQLRRLDLSRDSYDFTLTQLVRSIKSIRTLTWLNLPRDCMVPYEQSFKAMEQHNHDFWPQSLQSLQFNEQHLVSDEWQWDPLLACLPPALTDLSFRSCTSYALFDRIGPVNREVPQLRNLTISVGRADDVYYLNQITKPFPNITKLTIPAMTRWIFRYEVFMLPVSSWAFEATAVSLAFPPQQIQILDLEQSADFVSSRHITAEILSDFVTQCPRLVRIEVPEVYLSDAGDDDSEMDSLNEKLSKRAEESRAISPLIVASGDEGIFVTEDISHVNVGLRRSFHHRDWN